MPWLRFARWFAQAPVRSARRFPSVKPRLEVLERRDLLIAPPTLIYPTGLAVPTLPTFSWTAVAGAADYNVLLVDKTAQHSQQTMVTATTWIPGSALIDGHSYQWSVETVDTISNPSGWSTDMNFVVSILSAPMLLAPSGSAPAAPTLSWTAVTGAAYYDISMTDQNTGTTVQQDNIPGTAWVETNLTLGEGYSWWVRGVEANGNPGPWSTALTFDTSDLTAPVSVGPSGPAAPQPTFSWTAVSGADHYEIYIQDQYTGAVQRHAFIASTSWTPSAPLVQGDLYAWWVRAVDDNGFGGAWSNEMDFSESVLPPPVPIGPTGSAPLPTFTWNAVDGADHYDIYVLDTHTRQVLRDEDVLGTTWTSTSPLNQQDNYTWWVRAIDGKGYAGQWSATMNFSVPVLAAPTLLAPGGSGTFPLPTFSWAAVDNADHYYIWVQDMATGQVLSDQDVTGTTWVPPNPLNQGDNYTWWVQTVDSVGGASRWSAPMSFTVAAMDAPTGLSPGGSSLPLPTLSWNAVAGADHYDVWLQDMKTGLVLRDQDVAGTIWSPASTLVSGDNYKWWVRAVDAVNSPGPWSATQSFTVYALPAAGLIGPSGTTLSQPTFGWTPVTGADHYDVWVQDTTKGKGVSDPNVAGTTWVPASTLTVGDNYTWWVEAVDAAGDAGPWSDGMKFTLAPLLGPSQSGPSGATSAQPTFSWTAVPGAFQYALWMQDAKTKQVLSVPNVSGTSWSPSTPLNAGDSYSWYVRALDDIGSPGAWSSGQTFTVAALAAPSLFGPGGSTNSQPTFNWSLVAGADHYYLWMQNLSTGAVLRATNVAGTTWTPATPLIVADTYQWFVEAITNSGSASPWSTSLEVVVTAM